MSCGLQVQNNACRAAKNNWHAVNSVVVRIIDVKTSGTTMSKIDDNEKDYQELDVVVGDKETIDMTG